LKVACFPGAEALEITQVYDPLKIRRKNITGIEIDPKVYKILEKEDLGIELYNEDALDFFRNYKGKDIDIVSLDYTGMFTP
jgi:16S rRNA A1518/A1519 N6-dimethyltransferase RsmA/KsgA/DIM1 with predicted DNA glycosylase/AP lyase activity